ncbi:MAG: asparagine synthase (glutamine-hydrolyzing) [Gammaproteobacteria bacterium]|nr:MAG: asparagine synthase (glutamine-hydrolyzing) [Gammaproteobacteria bacterium]
MCGIAGVARLSRGSRVTQEQLERMCSVIRHRGPDDDGIGITGNVGMGMRRLSIIDVAGSKQPIFNEDRSVRTVFNGEIYNYRELRKELSIEGHTFRTSGDTETIVHAYEEYGLDFPNHLNGMFAIALHDSKAKTLHLVRDHLGIKPLYYMLTKDFLVWGSEVKVLLASGLFRPELKVDAVNQFLTWEYVPGADTLMQGVHKLKPGEMLSLDLATGRSSLVEYWDIPETPGTTRSDAEWTDEVEHKIVESVRAQMVSDVPLGAFLSGGVDSSIVASAMGRAQTFSIGFDDPSYNELSYSKEVADHLGLDHVTEVIRPHVVDLFDSLMFHLDDPIGDFSIFPTFLVSRLAREHVTVALSGDGADELFGGYETYIANAMARRYGAIPAAVRKGLIEPAVKWLRPRAAKKGLINKAKRFIEGAALSPELEHCRWRKFLDAKTRDALFTTDALHDLQTPSDAHIVDLFERAGDRTDLDRSLYVDVKSYLSDNILTKVDRMSMAVSLEARVPYLDKDLVELAFRVPDKLKVHKRTTKVMLKEIAARHVPANCVYRPKEGFSIPIKNFLATQFRPLMDELLDSTRIRNAGLFNPQAIEALKQQHLSGHANHSHVLWSLIVFEAWQDKWLNVVAGQRI